MTYQPTKAAPPPEPMKSVTVRLFEDDVEELRRAYPYGISEPIRRLVRRLADKHREDAGEKPRGMPPPRPQVRGD